MELEILRKGEEFTLIDLLLFLLVIERDSVLNVLTRVELVDRNQGLFTNHIKFFHVRQLFLVLTEAC